MRLMLSLRIALMAGLVNAAGAFAYPDKPIRVIQPYAPGGGVEAQARAVGQFLSEKWDQPVVIDGRPGAGSALGTQLVARAAADGYTLLFTNAAFAAASSLSRKALFDPIREFAPVVLVGKAPLILVVNPALPGTLGELIAYAKTHPGKLHYGSSGPGTASHLALEYLASSAGVSWVHVPYRGSAPAVVALLGGEVQLSMFSASSVVAHIRSGKLRALGVTTKKRSIVLPDVPPLAEAGLPGYEVLQWSGVFAPAGTPAGIVATVNRAINEALGTAEVRERLQRIGLETAGGSPERFAAFVRAEVVKWRKVIRDARITAE